MAEVTELVTVFKFEGDTKPLEDAGDALQEVSENSSVVEKRTKGASDAFLGMGKDALIGLTGVASLGAALAKITQTVFQLGQETAELKGLGIDPIAFRETEDLFTKLGAADGDAENFVKKIAEAQNQLSLGKDAPFARSLQEQFGVLIQEGDNVNDVLSRLREATEKQGFTAGQISVKAGELGFSPEFSKVLLATNSQFSEATEAIKNLAQVDRELLDQSQATAQAMKELKGGAVRLFERISVGLIPVVDAVVDVLAMIIDGWSRIFNLADELLLPVFSDMFALLDKHFLPTLETVTKFIENVFLTAFEGVAKAFDFFVNIINKYVLPVIKLLVDTFFDIVDAIRKAISKIPFVGNDKDFTPIERPTFGQGISSSTNTSSNINNQSSTNINITGLSADQINELIKTAQQKKTSMASGSW